MDKNEKTDKIEVKDMHKYLNSEVDIFLLVTKKELREGKNDYFLRVELTDSTGPISGNVWSNAHATNDLFAENDVVKVRAAVTSYKEQIQFNIKKIRKAEPNEYDLNDFIKKTKKDQTALCDKVFALINSINDPFIKKLLLSIFEDNETWQRFITCPAAKSWHHNFVGGLLDHTVTVAEICDFASKLYPVNRDELIAGALLHDFGKIYEYNSLPAIDFTDEGRLLGHIVIGDHFVDKKASEINLFPPKTLMKLRHLILSHHGELEKGAAKVPQTLEAIILHYADNMDAQAMGVTQLIEAATAPNASWTEFDKLNNRYIFIG